jgi:transposase
MRFDLSDEEWALLEPLMPKSRKSARADDRKIMNAIFYVLRTGMPWRDLPERYGPYTTAYNRFNRWSRRGIWKRIFDTLASRSRDSLYLIDSTIVKAHRAASGANVWPAPSASGFVVMADQSAQTYPAFRLCRWPRWRSAHSAPHKGDGIECHLTP